MCYSDDASPPAPPVRGAVGEHDDLVLESADGTRFGAYYAHPAEPGSVGMVVLPDVRGLHGFYKQLACRFAEAGMHSVAIDYFGRTAGVGSRDEDFPFREHVDKLDRDRVHEDVAPAVARLRAPLLLLAAGQDFTPVAEVEAFAERVRTAGVEAELHVYPDAPHSFFDRSFAEHWEECADAWRRVLDFVARHRS